jgi:hypothetical protein
MDEMRITAMQECGQVLNEHGLLIVKELGRTMVVKVWTDKSWQEVPTKTRSYNSNSHLYCFRPPLHIILSMFCVPLLFPSSKISNIVPELLSNNIVFLIICSCSVIQMVKKPNLRSAQKSWPVRSHLGGANTSPQHKTNNKKVNIVIGRMG